MLFGLQLGRLGQPGIRKNPSREASECIFSPVQFPEGSWRAPEGSQSLREPFCRCLRTSILNDFFLFLIVFRFLFFIHFASFFHRIRLEILNIFHKRMSKMTCSGPVS